MPFAQQEIAKPGNEKSLGFILYYKPFFLVPPVLGGISKATPQLAQMLVVAGANL
jgi:hypothetical protein